jgi:pilus assembly protein CpaE
MFTAKTLIDDKVAGFEAGADDYLTKPTHPAELASRVKSILARNAAQRPSATLRGATIGVLGAKGGVGTTTVALNLASARLIAGENPVIADFRLGQGSLGIALGLARSVSMATVLSKPLEEIRPRLIENELTAHPSGLRALLSSARAAEAQMEISPEAAIAVVRSLRSVGRPAVFDLGTGNTALNARLLREMDQLVLVVDPVSVTLTIARELLRELQAARTDSTHVHVVVVNRAAIGVPPSWNDVEQYLGHEIRAVISLAAELLTQALQSNVPVVLAQPTAIISTQFIKLADDLHSRVRMPAGGEPG